MTERISRKEIEDVKRQFILRNMRLTPVEAARLLGVSVRSFYRLVEEGLIKTVPIRPGCTRGTRCTAEALDEYRKRSMGNDYEPLEV